VCMGYPGGGGKEEMLSSTGLGIPEHPLLDCHRGWSDVGRATICSANVGVVQLTGFDAAETPQHPLSLVTGLATRALCCVC